MFTKELVKTSCGICYHACGVVVSLEDGKVVAVEGDSEHPRTHGAICPKGLASLEYLYHPDRLKYPLKRKGERGSGKWERITWDEALGVVAGELMKAKNNYGAESVAVIQGVYRSMLHGLVERFAHAFGTPNIVSPGNVCFRPSSFASAITHGFWAVADLEYPPSCIILWGHNPSETNIIEHEAIIRALDKGLKLIVIDPMEIELTQRYKFWLQLRPGSDLALALGMINVIVNEGLFDKDFVNNWTVGFDELKTHIQNYSPEKVEEITWINADIIRDAARFYASNKPACILGGNAFEHNANSFQTFRAIAILKAITGNLGVPGGELQQSLLPPLAVSFSREFILSDGITADMRELSLNNVHKLLPTVIEAPPHLLVKTILEEDPYPFRAAYIQAANPLVTYSNAQETYKAFQKLDFLAAADLFMTPTAALADILLPAATYLEYDSINTHARFGAAQVQRKVVDVGECWSDVKIINELAKKLGLGEYFWDSEEQFLDAILKPAGLTFKEFKEKGGMPAVNLYRDYYEANGFGTPSRKVEIYSSQLKKWNFEPLPVYHEPPKTPYSAPELVREYPLIFTSRKLQCYRHTEGRQISSLRNSHPEPVINIHPATASKLGIEEGDWVYIETERGRIKQKANLTDGIDPRVVFIDYGWWFPEKSTSELYSWQESNINMLTDNDLPYNREVGSTNLRGLLCKVYKVI